MKTSLELTRELIRRESITPQDAGCLDILANHLGSDNFRQVDFSIEDVTNRMFVSGQGGPHLNFLGHTDVVPVGKISDWNHPPFAAEIVDGYLYGRGAADMKASIAAFVVAARRFVEQYPNHKGTLSVLLTSDEEGVADYGIRHVAPQLRSNHLLPDYCLVGEPSSTSQLGDIVKNGRRGSLGGDLIIFGKQGHVAYPHLAENPIHSATKALEELVSEHWDEGNESFPATSFQISNINAGTGATNVIPGELQVIFNFRYSTEVTYQELQTRTEAILNKHNLNYSLNWKLNGEAFLTTEGKLVDAISKSIQEELGISTQLSTAGGTSDGRFIAPLGVEVVELGPINSTIHQVNECVKTADIVKLECVYFQIIKKLLT